MAEDDPHTLEVEVIEIDGAAPPPPPARTHSRTATWMEWRQWDGRIRRLDPRWWPLWLFLGLFVFVALLTVGTTLAILYIAFRIIRGLLFALFPFLRPHR
jgi:hypothetical protein